MSNHHNHPSHVHNFINKHTAVAMLILIVGCFFAGYFIGKEDAWSRKHKDQDMKKGYMMKDYQNSVYR